MSYDIDITKTPPAHEPERQYYYMEKAKDFVEIYPAISVDGLVC